MNRQLISAAKVVLAPKTVANSTTRNSSAYKAPASWYPASMNELPVPQGSWKTAYDAQQRKYNMHLITGVGFFLFTLFTLKTSGLVTLNASIPSLPKK